MLPLQRRLVVANTYSTQLLGKTRRIARVEEGVAGRPRAGLAPVGSGGTSLRLTSCTKVGCVRDERSRPSAAERYLLSFPLPLPSSPRSLNIN